MHFNCILFVSMVQSFEITRFRASINKNSDGTRESKYETM